MKLEWDERKNQSNYARHGFDFADAFRIFNLPMIVDLDEREDYSEIGWSELVYLMGEL